jgi:hypothetical protein
MTSHWLDPARAALELAEAPVTFFVRDDDGGWNQPSLDRLLAVAADLGVVVDVAVIPGVVDDQCAKDLAGWISAGVAKIHQHGWIHLNRVAEGRKCEFGSDRALIDLRSDLVSGQQRMAAVFGDAAQPIFTPPWNRCGRSTAELLSELGFEVLSRESKAEPFGIDRLVEVPVNFDWFAARKGTPLDRDARGELLAGAIRSGRPVGVMLHHAVTYADELGEVAALFHLLASSPHTRPTTILDLARSSRLSESASD